MAQLVEIIIERERDEESRQYIHSVDVRLDNAMASFEIESSEPHLINDFKGYRQLIDACQNLAKHFGLDFTQLMASIEEGM